jgi:hypothetical protein
MTGARSLAVRLERKSTKAKSAGNAGNAGNALRKCEQKQAVDDRPSVTGAKVTPGNAGNAWAKKHNENNRKRITGVTAALPDQPTIGGLVLEGRKRPAYGAIDRPNSAAWRSPRRPNTSA